MLDTLSRYNTTRLMLLALSVLCSKSSGTAEAYAEGEGGSCASLNTAVLVKGYTHITVHTYNEKKNMLMSIGDV